MPQMNPMNWFILPLNFLIMYMMLLTVLFFLINPSHPQPKILTTKTFYISWLW